MNTMQGSKEKIALFDFCETLVSFQTADAFVRFVGEATGSARVSRMMRIHHFLDRKGINGRLSKLFPESSPGKRLVARGLKGFREDALDELAGRYYAQRLRPALIPEVVGRLRSLQRDGWRIVLVSGAYDSYLRFFAREYGIAQDDILATHLRFRKGVCTGTFDGKDCMYGNKIDYLERRFSREACESMAFSDSASDLPLLRWADRGVLVRRRSRPAPWNAQYGFTELIWED